VGVATADRTAAEDRRETVYEEAERRLGRPLTPSERRIDVEGADRDLAAGKRRLHDALEQEKRRYIRQQVMGLAAPPLTVTPEIVRALAWTVDAGRAHARGELERMGVTPARAYAEADLPERLQRLLRSRLRPGLARVQSRVDGAILSGGYTGVAQQAIIGRLAERIPGTLAIAADLISPAFDDGLSDVFRENEDAISGWQYTAIMDNATCDACSARDGEEYDTLDEALEVMPDFGPNPDCFGETRCRCRLVPTEPTEEALLGPLAPTGGLTVDVL
jgi:hypothetical protein